MKKIAIYHNLPSGGGKRALYELVKRLKNDYEIDLYILNTANEDFCSLKGFVNKIFKFDLKKISTDKRPWSFLMFITRIIDLFFLANVSKKVAKSIDKIQYKFVFVTNCQFIHHPYVLRYLKTRTILYSQEPPRMIYEKDYLKTETAGRSKIISILTPILYAPYYNVLKIIDRKNIRSADLVLVNSKFSQKIFKKYYNIDSTVLYLGVDLNKFKYQDIAKENVIISVGAISPLKGHLFTLKAISLIPEKLRPKFVIVGDRGYVGEDERLKEIARLKNVELEILSKISNVELVTQYNRAKITVCSAYLEPFGLTVIESLACQTPVVGVAEGGYQETIKDNQSGFLVKRDAQKFSKILFLLLANRDLREQFGKFGRKSVEKNFVWDKTYYNFKKCTKIS